MELYFAPLACSMATRISLYEAGAGAKFHQVDTKSKKVDDGSDYWTVNPMGQVPALRLDDGALLTENPAVLLYVADQHPQAQLAPRDGVQRYELIKWLSFVGTELHKVVFNPLLDRTSNDGAKTYAREKAKARFDVLEKHLQGREFLLDRFTVADAYLTTVLNWAGATKVDLKPWPTLLAYHKRMHERPSVKKAFGEELALYQQAQAKATPEKAAAT